MPEKISVLICTRDRPDTIEQAIESVALCEYAEFDLHIMDQSTTDATKVIVESLIERFASVCPIVYHHLDKAGLSRSYNAGMRVSDGALIACTDDDVIVPKNWLAKIGAAFESDSDLGLLYGQVVIPKTLEPMVAQGVIVPALTWNDRQRLFHRDRNFKVWGMGANMALRRSILPKVCGFDEAMGGGAPLRSSQDFDFSFRTYRAGYAVLLEPDVTVDHYGTRTPEQWPATEKNYGIGDGAFYSKHIRCGDFLALRLLTRQYYRVIGQAFKRTLAQKRLVPINPYGKYLFTGIREASRFAIDKQFRLYRETARAQIGVTEANVVTGTRAKP